MSSKYEGTTIGELFIIHVTEYAKHAGLPKRWARVRCSCGKEYDKKLERILRSEHPRCRACENTRRREEAADYTKHALWKTWFGMNARCGHTEEAQHPDYGGRGIIVCPQWRYDARKVAFLQFVADMGPKPKGRHSVGRRENDGPYSPGNCRWETPTQQANNTRANVHATHEGVTRTLAEWSRFLEVPAGSLKLAIEKYGMKQAVRTAELCRGIEGRIPWKTDGVVVPKIVHVPKFRRLSAVEKAQRVADEQARVALAREQREREIAAAESELEEIMALYFARTV